jgi:hypothetical protein
LHKLHAGQSAEDPVAKNQYFGDINDYRKYGLLRILESKGVGRLLVAWMLTPGDGGRDGGFRSYLEEAGKWMRYDSTLFSGLTEILRSAPVPGVSLIEASTLLPRTSFFPAVAPDGHRGRSAWRQELLRSARGNDLVFLDPDNGIEVLSKPIGRKGSSKYVSWQEIRDLWEIGCSILIYQHFCRESRSAFTERMVRELHARTGANFIDAIHRAHVLYLLVSQDRHADQNREAIALLPKVWGEEIKSVLSVCHQ